MTQGRALLTPGDSEFIHCVDLHTGELLWKQKRGGYLRLDCVHGGRAVLVGNDRIKAIQLEDGKLAWSEPVLMLPTDVAPTGRGFVSRGHYYLSLSSAEVAAIDLERGRIVERTASRDGAVLGNLIAYRGAVIVYDGEGLCRFDRVDALREDSQRRLEDDPQDVVALRSLAEIAYNQRRLDEALRLLDRAYAVDPDDLDTRDVMAECLTAALDDDFLANRERLGFLRELHGGSPSRLMNVLRIESEGLLKAGELQAAAQACIDLYQTPGAAGDLLIVGGNHQVTTSRWARAQLARIWRQATAAERQALGQRIGQVAAAPDSSGEELQRFVEFFGDLPASESSKLRLARRHAADGKLLASQQILLELLNSTDVSVCGEATARISQGLHKVGTPALAREFDAALLGEFSDVACLDGRTGRECYRQWSSEVGVANQWPRGRVEASESPTTMSRAQSGIRLALSGMRIERCDAVLQSATALMGEHTGEVVVRDGLGNDVFRAPAESSSGRFYRRFVNSYAVSNGSLLVASSGRQVVGFNLLGGQSNVEPKVLWRQNLVSNLDVSQNYSQQGAIPNGRPGTNRAPRTTWDNRWVGIIGPVNRNGCVLQNQRALICIDPLTGAEQWVVGDMPLECELFGDDRIVAAVPRGTITARLYDMVDGRYLGESTVPASRELATTRGRLAVAWRPAEDGTYELAAIDARNGDVAWRHTFASGSLIDVDKGRFIAVQEPNKRIVIVDADDGRIIVDYLLTARNTSPSTLHLSVGSEDIVLALGGGSSPRGWVVRSLRPVQDCPVIEGEVYSFERRTGRMKWSRPAEVSAQGLMLTQPVDLPIIVFAGRLIRQSRSRSPNTISVLVLDKRTGRTLFRSQELPLSSNDYCAVGQDEKQPFTALVQMASRTIRLQFTDDHVSPGPPALAEVETWKDAAGGGLADIGLKFYREMRNDD